jgi:hypothetical protein
MSTTKRYLRRGFAFILSVGMMAHLTVIQRFYLSPSDSGKQWSMLARWCELFDWLFHQPEISVVRSPQTQDERSESFAMLRVGDVKPVTAR